MKKWADENGIEYITLTNEKIEEALNVLRNGFFQDEVFCLGVGIDASKEGQRELEKLVTECVKDGLSIVGVDKMSNKIVGVTINKFQVAPPVGHKGFFEHFRDNYCTTKSAIALINEMIEVDKMVDVYEQFKTDCSFEIMFLGVDPDFRRRQIGKNLVLTSMNVCRQLPSTSCPRRPPIATAIFTSPHSIAIGRFYQFDELVHVPLKTRVFEGKSFCDNPKIGDNHPGAILMVKRL